MNVCLQAIDEQKRTVLNWTGNSVMRHNGKFTYFPKEMVCGNYGPQSMSITLKKTAPSSQIDRPLRHLGHHCAPLLS